MKHLLTLVTIALLTLSCGDGMTGLEKATRGAPLPVSMLEEIRYQYQRPDGGFVVSKYEIPADKRDEVLQRVVRGLCRTINASQAANPTWTFYSNTRDFDIVHLVEPMATNQDGSPALMVYGQFQSAGTVWNLWMQDSYIGPPYLILPDQGGPNYGWRHMQYFEESVRHESEHAREWMNDRRVFYRYVGPSDVHPHFPDAGGCE